MKKPSAFFLFIAALLTTACLFLGTSEPTAPTVTITPTSTSTEPAPPTETPEPTPTGGGGGHIAFVSNRRGHYEIFIMSVNGMDVQPLSETPGSNFFPVWSPDGTRLAYSSDPTGEDFAMRVYMMDADGSNAAQITNFSSAVTAWSQDGTQLLMNSDAEAIAPNTPDLFVVGLDGSIITQLVDAPADIDAAGRWSPDGSKIAFYSDRDGNLEIYVMDADGGNPLRLTNDPGMDMDPAWSPDGTKIAFTSNRDGDFEIYVMNADGSNLTRLTDHSGMDMDVAWSPDGTLIAFASDRNGNFEIYVMNSDGSNMVQVTFDPSLDFQPSWQP